MDVNKCEGQTRHLTPLAFLGGRKKSYRNMMEIYRICVNTSNRKYLKNY
jgi:hypothetical protein